MKRRKKDAYRSRCPIAAALDLVGDKWSLVILRDIVAKKRRYGHFLGSPEGIPTNVLAQRLKQMEEDGLVDKQPYQTNPPRYEYRLTAKGADLLPVLQQLALWGNRHIANRWAPSARFLGARPKDLLEEAA